MLVQAFLGRAVVLEELDPWWVTAHFVTALLLILDVTVVAAGVLHRDRQKIAVEPSFTNLAATTTSVVGVLLLVGHMSARATPSWSSPIGR